jgi:hypothetical protein
MSIFHKVVGVSGATAAQIVSVKASMSAEKTFLYLLGISSSHVHTQGTISALKKEIEKAWKMVDASHEKEAKGKETIQQLKMEIANLTRLVEQGSGLALGEESTLNDLLKQKEELVRERDMQVRCERGAMCANTQKTIITF